MSNRGTPNFKKGILGTPKSRGGLLTPTPAKSNTPRDQLRRQVITKKSQVLELKRKSSNEKGNEAEKEEEEVLNTAFRKSLTPRFKPKPTILNACYTPSSLYRNMKSTPRKLRLTTPSGTATTSTLTGQHNRNSSSNRKSKLSNGTNNDNDELEISNLTVAVRVRPLNAQECTRASVRNIVKVQGDNELTVYVGTSGDSSLGVSHSFTYDHVFYSCDPENKNFATQEDVFHGTAKPLIDRAFEGYNACLFAYGQTGSGKSYSMMGIDGLDDDNYDIFKNIGPHPEAGVIPRFCYQLFKRIETLKDRFHAEVEISYFEIYNEKIHDLLCVAQMEALSNSGLTSTPQQYNQMTNQNQQSQRPALKVREHPIWGPYIVDLSVHPVDSYEAIRNWLAVGNSQRATAATGMNDKSSRSHSIFNIVLSLTENSSESGTTSPDSDDYDRIYAVKNARRSKISLVDLAGSERINAKSTNCDRIREGVHINKSLLTLGKVIAALADTKKNTSGSSFVPYRESVLTWLLRENLGGNSKTVMLATISPASVHIDETLATLRYACQARTIVNRVKVNESPHDKIIRELRSEVERLKSLRNEYERQKRFSGNSNLGPRKIIIETSVDESEVEALRQQLAERERELAKAQKSWMERLKEAEDLRKSELRLLKRKGLALELSAEQKQACLVNLTADPILSGTLFYILPPGQVKIGRTRTSTYASQPDIVLDGPLVGYHHCMIENVNGQLFITPENNDFETFLNGELVNDRTQMYHGDRLVIGGSHYFRISNPFCLKRDKTKLVDFELAHQEILQKQEAKLRRELEEEKQAALSRIELERNENERNFQERLQQLELEQLKYKCNTEILETERKAFEEQSASKKAQFEEALMYTPSFKSTLLDDINRIMQNPSEDSLHKTQMMVKEGTQRCRNVGLNYDLRQSKVLDEFGMFRTVILILDKDNGQKAEWPVARLGVWLDYVRECDNINIENIFQSVDLEWQTMESDLNETLNDSLNSSRISLNISIVKDVFLKQPLQKLPKFLTNNDSRSSPSHSSSSTEGYRKNQRPQHLAKTALMNLCGGNSSSFAAAALQMNTKNKSSCNIRKMLTFDEETETKNDELETSCNTEESTDVNNKTFNQLASDHIRDMQRSALRLKRLCEKAAENQENNNPCQNQVEPFIRDSLTSLEHILHEMRSFLDQQKLTQVEKDISPTKTPKSVRFLID